MKNIKKGYKKPKYILTPQQEEVFRQAFQIFDTNHSNSIDQSQLSDLMKSLGFRYSPQKIREILNEVDKDYSGVIQLDEFIEFMRKHIINQNSIRNQIEKIFQYFDEDHTGYIDFKKLKNVVEQCCGNMSESTIKGMIEAGDTDGDGKISKYEFMRIMKKMKLV